MKYVVEHLEDAMGEWCGLEYRHMADELGDNLLITNMSDADKAMLPQTHQYDVKPERFATLGYAPERVCLLDPKAPEVLSPSDREKFDVMLFGGILGDDPPRDRTGILRPLGTVRRHLGPRQMSTDTAVIVCKKVIEDQVPLDSMKFRDDIDVKTGKHDSTLLPYRYLVYDDGKVMLPKGLLVLLKRDLDLTAQLADEQEKGTESGPVPQ